VIGERPRGSPAILTDHPARHRQSAFLPGPRQVGKTSLAWARTGERLSPALGYFQTQTRAPHAFQVTLDMDYVNADCFNHRQPMLVPARTFLSQLV